MDERVAENDQNDSEREPGEIMDFEAEGTEQSAPTASADATPANPGRRTPSSSGIDYRSRRRSLPDPSGSAERSGGSSTQRRSKSVTPRNSSQMNRNDKAGKSKKLTSVSLVKMNKGDVKDADVQIERQAATLSPIIMSDHERNIDKKISMTPVMETKNRIDSMVPNYTVKLTCKKATKGVLFGGTPVRRKPLRRFCDGDASKEELRSRAPGKNADSAETTTVNGSLPDSAEKRNGENADFVETVENRRKVPKSAENALDRVESLGNNADFADTAEKYKKAHKYTENRLGSSIPASNRDNDQTVFRIVADKRSRRFKRELYTRNNKKHCCSYDRNRRLFTMDLDEFPELLGDTEQTEKQSDGDSSRMPIIND